MRSLESVFREAMEDDFAGDLDDKYIESRVAFGVKIARDRETGDIEILNTSRGGDYYQEITKNEYDNFFKNGWRYGVYVVSLSNYRRKLDVIEQRIRAEINTRKNGRYIMGLKDMREHYLLKFSESSKIINQLN